MKKKMIERLKFIFRSNFFLSPISELLRMFFYFVCFIQRKKMIQNNPEDFIRRQYKKKKGRLLNLDNPKSYNEKLQWLKLFWHDEIAVICADKFRVREYVKIKGLEHILNDLIGVYSKSSEIDLKLLPEKFVLKPTHDSQHSLICIDKSKINWKKELPKLDFWLRFNFAYLTGEWPYKNIKPRIICEKFLEDKATKELLDYKFFCFNGTPKICRVIFYEEGQHKSNFYDMDWNFLKKCQEYPYSEKRIFEKPQNFNNMKEIARILSDSFPHVRVDLYSVNCKIYFGELTFFTTGGFGYFSPESFNYELGDMIFLPKKANPWKTS